MTRPVTEQQFDSKLPYYVAQAYLHADTIFENTLANPNEHIEIVSAPTMLIGVDTDYDTIRAFWQQRDDEATQRRYFIADMALEGTRLHLERDQWRRKAWIYNPPAQRHAWPGLPHTGDATNLVTPVMEFTMPTEPDEAPEINLGLYSHPKANMPFALKDIHDIDADAYRQAQFPRLTPRETTILEQSGVYRLHTLKVENMLEMLRLIAKAGPADD